MIQKLKKSNAGFTLVELIVVIAILGVLMAVMVPQYIQYVEKSRVGVDESYIGEVAHSMELAAAGDEALYGKTVTVNLTATTGVIAVQGTSTVAEVKAMTDALASVFPSQGTQVYKSKKYTTGDKKGTVVLTLGDDGKVDQTYSAT